MRAVSMLQTFLFILVLAISGSAAKAFPAVVQGDKQNTRSTWLVDTVADTGPGSLREALTNAAPGDRVAFDAVVFPPEAPGVIYVINNELPAIMVADLTIDAVGRGVILDGGNQIGDGLSLNADGTVIQGLQISNFTGNGINMYGAKNCLIGGNRELGEGNVISGNIGATGVYMSGTGTNDNVIAGNMIGTDPSGMTAMPNYTGVVIRLGAKRNIIGGQLAGNGNLISGNTNHGISIKENSTDHTVIQGNLVGTDLTGENLLGNGGSGIKIDSGPDHTLVGGYTQAARNIIAGNLNNGVSISGVSTNYTRVEGNYIGVNQSGKVALPNQMGIGVGHSAKFTQIGGVTPEVRNVISGNAGTGVHIELTSDTIVQGNYIGTDPSGTAAIPNLGSGIEILREGNNTIGGASQGDECTRARNLVSGNLGEIGRAHV